MFLSTAVTGTGRSLVQLLIIRYNVSGVELLGCVERCSDHERFAVDPFLNDEHQQQQGSRAKRAPPF